MAFRGLQVYRIVRNITRIHRSAFCTVVNEVNISSKPTKFATEKSFVYLEDPDTFGTLSGKPKPAKETVEDPEDIKELDYTETRPVSSQRLTIKQYADIIKQYVKHKRLKEAIDVLEVRMLKEDRVKPENYIYNILIGACADVGYTKKAFKLFNDMKRRALQPTGDTYTCLFQACTNSPWALDGLNKATRLRELIMEKQIEPNLTNYNTMIKAFGRCGDLATAFKIVDEMISKKIKIRVHTFNHILHACITDKDNGLRHALLVWRKMLKLREKPNIYSFNLMLKCVKECDLGPKEDFQELISLIQQEMPLAINSGNRVEILEIKKSEQSLLPEQDIAQLTKNVKSQPRESQIFNTEMNEANSNSQKLIDTEMDTDLSAKDLAITKNPQISMQFLDKSQTKPAIREPRTVPNLLSRVINMQQVLSLQEITTPQEKFNIIGGHEDFLKEMEVYSVKPDIKTFTQMLAVIEDTREAELNLLETMESLGMKADIDFYNMMIKKRCLRSDYDGAFEVKQMIEKEQKQRKRKHFLKKRLHLKVNIMTYGVLAMACKSQPKAEVLLAEMKEHQLKVNIQILGTLLRNGTAHNQFSYIAYILETVKEERVPVNQVFMRHLEEFNDKCSNFLKMVDENGQKIVKNPEGFERGYKKYLATYSKWLKEVEVEEALKPEHPWQQYREDYPITVQKDKVEIVMPKKFYKRSRKYIKYVPRAI